MQTKKKQAVILINLGTPDDPSPEAVSRYLKEFLMDPYVIDIPKPIRWFLVNQLIVPKRKYASAELYQKIWTKEGSPLAVYTNKLAQKLEKQLSAQNIEVKVAMRYANPSIQSVIESCAEQFEKILFIPLYPQFSEATTESTRKEIQKWIQPSQSYQIVESFYERENLNLAWAKQIKNSLRGKTPDHYLFSFHGLPERQLIKYSHKQCEFSDQCCDQMKVKNCYRAQCVFSAKAIAKYLNLNKNQYTVSFQSRLGRTKWIEPYTDEVVKQLKGRSIAVVAPSFICDCLETLEELAIRLKEQFINEVGGKEFYFIPCLNDSDDMVAVLNELVGEYS